MLDKFKCIASLMYVTHSIRPNMPYTICMLSRFTNKLSMSHWEAIGRTFGYLKKTRELSLVYNGYPAVLEGYCDASLLTDNYERRTTISWLSF